VGAPSSDIQSQSPNRRRLRNERPALEDAAATIVKEAERLGYPKASCFALRLAIEEAMSNAFRHGHRDLEPDADIEIAWDANPDRVTIVVEDQGPGFDPESLPDPTAPENIEKASGRGLLLIRAYMSSLDFNVAGNRVTMVYLHPGRSAGR
jgi:serine/threonine-protein kinase RsbW